MSRRLARLEAQDRACRSYLDLDNGAPVQSVAVTELDAQIAATAAKLAAEVAADDAAKARGFANRTAELVAPMRARWLAVQRGAAMGIAQARTASNAGALQHFNAIARQAAVALANGGAQSVPAQYLPLEAAGKEI